MPVRDAQTPISYEDFVERVRRFKRTSVLLRCQRLGWKIWKNPGSLPFNDAHLCQAHLGTVAAIGAAAGNEHRERLATDGDVVRLCHDFLRIEERFLDRSGEVTEELMGMLGSSRIFAAYEIPREVVGLAALRITLARLVRSQWDARMAAYYGIPREWELLRRLYRRLDSDLIERHQRVLGIEPIGYMRAGLALFALLDTSTDPGFTDVSTATFAECVDEALALDRDALEHVAVNRLARSKEELRAWLDGVRQLPRLDRKYAPSPLVANPLFRLDSSFPGTKGNGREVVCVSPAHFVWALQTSAMGALPEAARVGEDPNTLLRLGVSNGTRYERPRVADQ